MGESITFGSREKANEFREKVEEYRKSTDDRRTKTVELKDSTPDRILQRAESEAFTSETDESAGRGMEELSKSERESLKSQHRTFSWQDYGFEAMRAKAALTAKGATEWQDFYEPGEGVGGALNNLRQSKQRSQQSSAEIGVGGDYTDEGEQASRQRQRRQTERVQAQQLENAKLPAFMGDEEAASFLEEEQRFSDDIFAISFSGEQPSGEDFQRLREAHEDRSERAQRVDERRTAEVTRDPLKWSRNKSTLDFPGIDTVEPERLHRQRSERAQERDEDERAPLPDTKQQWAQNPGRYDLPGIDTPTGGGEGLIPTRADTTNQLADREKESVQITEPPEAERKQRESFMTELSERDVTLSPEEAFDGVGANSRRAIGGFEPNVERETDRLRDVPDDVPLEPTFEPDEKVF
jgi:hypothetical protein